MLFGVLIYEGVEPIDLATFGVLSMARRIRSDIELCTIAPKSGVTVLASGLRVIADYDLATAPRLDVLIITGGPGWPEQARSPEMLNFLRRRAAEIPVVSVCTGGLILAASGLLDHKAATTKRAVVPPELSPLQQLRDEHPDVMVREAASWTRAISSPAAAYRFASTRCSTFSKNYSAPKSRRKPRESSNTSAHGRRTWSSFRRS
jgi:transcriptional regulator GlxA family with amidase domain